MLLWQTAVTDRSQSDVERVQELLEKGWQNFSDEEKTEWNAGMKGALNVSDILRIQNNVNLLKDVLELDMEVFNMGKNLLHNTASTTTIGGITFTINEDGSVTLNGTSTGATLIIEKTSPVPKGDLILSISDVSVGAFLLAGYFKEDGTIVNEVKRTYNSTTLAFPDEAVTMRVYIGVPSGNTMDNVTVYPMIRSADINGANYERYSGRNVYAPTDIVFNELLDNVETIRSAYCIHATTPKTPEAPLNTYSKWNDIERILTDVYEILLNNFHYYCGGEIYAGDDTGLLL